MTFAYLHTRVIPNSTIFSCKAPTSLILNLLSKFILDMLDMCKLQPRSQTHSYWEIQLLQEACCQHNVFHSPYIILPHSSGQGVWSMCFDTFIKSSMPFLFQKPFDTLFLNSNFKVCLKEEVAMYAEQRRLPKQTLNIQMYTTLCSFKIVVYTYSQIQRFVVGTRQLQY